MEHRYAGVVAGYDEPVLYPPNSEPPLSAGNTDQEAVAYFIQNFGLDLDLVTEVGTDRVVHVRTTQRPY